MTTATIAKRVTYSRYDQAETDFRRAAGRDKDHDRIGQPMPGVPLYSTGWEHEGTDYCGLGTRSYCTVGDEYVVHFACLCGSFDAVAREPWLTAKTGRMQDAALTLLIAHARVVRDLTAVTA